MAAHTQPIQQIKASDGLAGQGAAPFFLTFDAAEIEEGPMGFLLEDRFLYAAFLHAMAEEPRITCGPVKPSRRKRSPPHPPR